MDKDISFYKTGKIIFHNEEKFIFLEPVYAGISSEVRVLSMDGLEQKFIPAKELKVKDDETISLECKKMPNGWTLKYLTLPEAGNENTVFALSTSMVIRSIEYIGDEIEIHSIMKVIHLENHEEEPDFQP